jgi:lambda family phage minor tail protein L
MAKEKVNTDATLLTPRAVLVLYKFDGTNIGLSEPYYFYSGTDFDNQPLVYDEITYTPIPMEVTEFEIDGQGRLPRPKLTIANINGVISRLILEAKDLAGSIISKKRVFLKYIDDVNFPGGVNPWGTADPEAAFADEIFSINRKTSETKDVVQFELACPWEVDNVYLPGRLIFALICVFKYRDPETCGYSGPPIADKANKKFTDGYGFTLNDRGEWSKDSTYNAGDYVFIKSTLPINFGESFYFVCLQNNISGISNKPGSNPLTWKADQCSKNCAGCKIRNPNGALPFGGFPGVARSKLSI